MKVFDKELVEEICRENHIGELGSASIMDSAKVAAILEKRTGIPFVRMDLGSPCFEPNLVGREAEKAALDAGVGAKYLSTEGLPELKEAAARFVKAFLDIELPVYSFIPTSGSMLGAFASFASLTQKSPEKNRVLIFEPSFAANKIQLAILNIPWTGIQIADFRGPALEGKLEEILSGGDYAALMYSNPNNPSWMCLDDSEIRIIAKVAGKYGVTVIEDLAYFCMDNRTKGYAVPYKEPYPPTIAKYYDNFILLMSASKIFSYAGQRIAVMVVSPELFNSRSETLARRYGTTGVFGNTLCGKILDMITSGSTASTQYGFAAMLNGSCDGTINFVEDTKAYAERSAVLKKIFLSHGFSLTYDKDIDRDLADGFFFAVSYPGFTSSQLMAELMYYGASTITLKNMGAARQGVRICSSGVREEHFPLLDRRMTEFEKDHVLE